MELSFKELKKRDVVNIVDGKCFGKITDLTLSFPEGILRGITVPAKKPKWFLSFLAHGELYIEEKNIIKIGGDVILVNIRCGDTCSVSIDMKGKVKPCKPTSPCSSLCANVKQTGDDDINIDLSDY